MSPNAYRELIRKLCAEHGIKIIPHGAAMLLRGPGVYILTTDLRTVSIGDLID